MQTVLVQLACLEGEARYVDGGREEICICKMSRKFEICICQMSRRFEICKCQVRWRFEICICQISRRFEISVASVEGAGMLPVC